MLKVIVQNPFDPETASPQAWHRVWIEFCKTQTLSFICKNGSRGNISQGPCIHDNYKYSKA